MTRIRATLTLLGFLLLEGGAAFGADPYVGRAAITVRATLPAGIPEVLEEIDARPISTSAGAATDERLISVQKKLDSMLARIRLPKDGPGPIPVILVNDLTPNAAFLSAPSGSRAVLVNLGLLRLVDSDDQLAFVLGHELEHPTSQLDAYSKGDLHQRVVEWEVDSKSVMGRMLDQGYNPHEAFTFMRKLRDHTGDGGTITHVSSATRQDSLEAILTGARRKAGRALPPESAIQNDIISQELKSIFTDPAFLKNQEAVFQRVLGETSEELRLISAEIPWRYKEEWNRVTEKAGRKVESVFFGLEPELLWDAQTRLDSRLNTGLADSIRSRLHRNVAVTAAIQREIDALQPERKAERLAKLLASGDIEKHREELDYLAHFFGYRTPSSRQELYRKGLAQGEEALARHLGSLRIPLWEESHEMRAARQAAIARSFARGAPESLLSHSRDSDAWRMLADSLPHLPPAEHEAILDAVTVHMIDKIKRDPTGTSGLFFDFLGKVKPATPEGLARRRSQVLSHFEWLLTQGGYDRGSTLGAYSDAIRDGLAMDPKEFYEQLLKRPGARQALLKSWEGFVGRIGRDLDVNRAISDAVMLADLGVDVRADIPHLRQLRLGGARSEVERIIREFEWDHAAHDLSLSEKRELIARLAILPVSEKHHATSFVLNFEEFMEMGPGVSRERALRAAMHLRSPFGSRFRDYPESEIHAVLDRLRGMPGYEQTLRQAFSYAPRQHAMSWVAQLARAELSSGRFPKDTLGVVAVLAELNPGSSYNANPTPEIYRTFIKQFETPSDRVRALFALWDAQDARVAGRTSGFVEQSQIHADVVDLLRESLSLDELREVPLDGRLEILRRFNRAASAERVFVPLLGHRWDTLLETVLDEVARRPELLKTHRAVLEPLFDPALVRSLSYNQNQLRLARFQLENTVGLSALARKGLATDRLRPPVLEIGQWIERQFPRVSGLRDDFINEVERTILSTHAESAHLGKLRIDPNDWYKLPEVIGVDALRMVYNLLKTQEERWAILEYWLGIREEPPIEVIQRITKSPAIRDPDLFLATCRRHFQTSSPTGRTLILQPLLDEKSGLLADPESVARIQKLILGERYGDPMFRSVFQAYLDAVPAAERRLLVSQVLSSFVGRNGRGGASLSAILEGMGPFGIKAGQFLRSSGLVSPELAKELDSLLDSASPPNRAKIYEDLKKAFGEDLAKIGSVNELAGSGSVNYVVQADMTDPVSKKTRKVVIRIQRDNVEGLAANENDVWQVALGKLKNSSNPDERRLSAVAEEARQAAFSTLQAGGQELDLSIERENLGMAEDAYLKIPMKAGELGVEVARPVDSLQRLVPAELQSKVSVYEFVESTPIKHLTDPKERSRVAKAIVNAELEALLKRGAFDPDGHKGNWLYDKARGRVVRIDYAQIRRLSSKERDAIRAFMSTLLRPRLGQQDATTLAPFLKDLFDIDVAGSGKVGDEALSKALAAILREDPLPAWKQPVERLFALRSGLEKRLSAGGNIATVRLREYPRAALASVGKLMAYREDISSFRFARAVTRHTDVSMPEIVLSETRELLARTLKRSAGPMPASSASHCLSQRLLRFSRGK